MSAVFRGAGLVILAISAWYGDGDPAFAQASSPQRHDSQDPDQFREYTPAMGVTPLGDATCGVYAMGAALSALGQSVDLLPYLNADYVQSRKGTGSEALSRMAAEHGLRATPVENLNFAALTRFDTPALLNLEGGDYRGLPFGHWVCYLGMTSTGRVQLFDAAVPGKMVEMTPGELDVNWQGRAVVVSPQMLSMIEQGQLAAAALLPTAGWIGVALVGVLWIRRQFPCGEPAVSSMNSRAFASFGVLVAVMLGLTQLSANSLLHNPTAVGWVAARYRSAETPTIGLPEFTKAYQDRNEGEAAWFVDSRFASDFAIVHLEGSLSLPINAPLQQFATTTRKMATDDWVIVFCAGPDCDYGETIANRFHQMGYSKVRLFVGGLRELLQTPGFIREQGVVRMEASGP